MAEDELIDAEQVTIYQHTDLSQDLTRFNRRDKYFATIWALLNIALALHFGKYVLVGFVGLIVGTISVPAGRIYYVCYIRVRGYWSDNIHWQKGGTEAEE